MKTLEKRTILFTKSITQAVEYVGLKAIEYPGVALEAITRNSQVPGAVSAFVAKQTQLLIVPKQFANGWYIRADDVEIEFSPDFPEGDCREQAKGRVREVIKDS